MAESQISASNGLIPKTKQVALDESKEYTSVREGLAHILIPSASPDCDDPKVNDPKVIKGNSQEQSVFYNPIQQFNRDLSVLAIRAFGEVLVAERREKYERVFSKKKTGAKKKQDAIAVGEHVTSIEGASGQATIGILTELSVVEGQELTGKDAVKDNQQRASEPEQGGKRESIDDIHPQKRKRGMEGLEETGFEATGKRSKVDIPNGSSATPHDGTRNIGRTPDPNDRACADQTSGPTPAQIAGNNSSNKEWKPSFSILDALSATGLRALRYAQEIPIVTLVTANDLSPAATALIRLNVQHNHLEDKVIPITGNALAHMYGLLGSSTLKQLTGQDVQGKYDVIDLDPYGTAAPFLDAAVQALNNGGLLCVTCTDAAVFASTCYPEKAYALYGGLPIKGPHSHEGGLRLILHAIAISAARYGIAIEPLLSLSIDFYARLFVRVRKSPAEVKFLAGKTMLVYNCDQGCGAWTTQSLARNREVKDRVGGIFYKHGLAQAPSTSEHCDHCGSKTHLAGPMYAGPLHSPDFIQSILKLLPLVDKEVYATTSRVEGMLATALEESLTSLPPLSNDEVDGRKPTASSNRSAVVDSHPFFFIPNALAKVLHCVTPSEEALRGAFMHLGYRVTRSHTKRGSMRTDAPWSVIWEVMREWTRQRAPPKAGAIKEGTAGWGIMYRAVQTEGPKTAQSEPHNATDGNKTDFQSEDAESDPVAPPITGQIKVVFDEELGKQRDPKKLVRFQLNPRANWGPMNRAKGD